MLIAYPAMRGTSVQMPSPTDPSLAAGYAWFRWTLPDGNQRTSCLTAGDRQHWANNADIRKIDGIPGCWMRLGYAWGQRKKGASEFSTQSTTTSTPTVTRPPGYTIYTPQQRVPTPPPPTTRTPTRVPTPPPSMQVPPPTTQRTPPLAPPQPPPEIPEDVYVPTPPPSEPPTAEVVPPDDGGSIDQPADAGQRPTFLRQLGNVVGLGLLAAVGLTIYRKRRRKSKRR